MQEHRHALRRDAVLLVVDAGLGLGRDEGRRHLVPALGGARGHPVDVVRGDVLVRSQVEELILAAAARNHRVARRRRLLRAHHAESAESAAALAGQRARRREVHSAEVAARAEGVADGVGGGGAGAEQIEQRVGELLDALVHQPLAPAPLQEDGVDEADGLGAPFGDVLVLELLRPREAEALVEVAARLGDVRVEGRRQHHPQPTARNVREAHVVPVEVAAGHKEDAIRPVGLEAVSGWEAVEHAVKEGGVEAEGESPAALDEEVGAHRVPHRRRHRREQRTRVLVA